MNLHVTNARPFKMQKYRKYPGGKRFYANEFALFLELWSDRITHLFNT